MEVLQTFVWIEHEAMNVGAAPTGSPLDGRAFSLSVDDVEAIVLAWHERQITGHLEYLAEVRDQAGDAGERLEAVLDAYALIFPRAPGRALPDFRVEPTCVLNQKRPPSAGCRIVPHVSAYLRRRTSIRATAPGRDPGET
ncbi:MAG: hypothetical protein ACRDGE_12225 [Candidatus Limnocylindria bacterium]